MAFERVVRDTLRVTKAEAEQRCAELRQAHPERLFVVSEGNDDWQVVEAKVAGMHPRSGDLHAETRAGPDVTPDPSEDQSPPIWSQRGF